MKATARSKVAAVLALHAAACLTVHCGKDAAPADEGSSTPTVLAYDGQSGSEVTGSPGLNTISCPCGFPGWLPGAGALLRVTLLSREAGLSESSSYAKCRPSQRATAWDGPPPLCARLRLRVEEVLHGAVSPEPGSEIETDSDGFLPCFWSLDEVAVGQQALAAVSWPLGELPACAARTECRDACVQDFNSACSRDAGASSDAGNASSSDDSANYAAQCSPRPVEADCSRQCEESSAAICPARPLPSAQVIQEGGSAQLTLWAESIVFARTDRARLAVPSSELARLWGDHEQCLARLGDWASLPGAFGDGDAP